MKITIITDGQPYVFEKVSYISVDHEEGDMIVQYGNGEGFIIEDEEKVDISTEKVDIPTATQMLDRVMRWV